MLPDGIATQVEALFVYPVKACAGMPVDRLQVDSAGHILGDREWAVIDAQPGS